MLLAGVAAMLVFPYPVPKRATPAQRLYLSNCATCHGASGGGSWRATIFLMHPSDLSDPRVVDGLTDEYLYLLIKNGGAPLGKPGMPAFGFYLRDDEIRERIGYLRALPKRCAATGSSGCPRGEGGHPRVEWSAARDRRVSA